MRFQIGQCLTILIAYPGLSWTELARTSEAFVCIHTHVCHVALQKQKLFYFVPNSPNGA